jgi:hypothetical protein
LLQPRSWSQPVIVSERLLQLSSKQRLPWQKSPSFPSVRPRAFCAVRRTISAKAIVAIAK